MFIEATPDGHWRILCKTRGKLSPGETITLTDREGRPGAKLWLIERLEEGQWLAHAETDESTDAILNRLGRVPLPPYIRGGNMVDADVASYQTVYAERPGAIAAPTAGLHFTKELIKALEARGVTYSRITLHVGLGTFRPIESDNVGRASDARRDGRNHGRRGDGNQSHACRRRPRHCGGHDRYAAVGNSRSSERRRDAASSRI